MIDNVRYSLGVLNVIILPPGLLFWFVIHPWARWWRRLGPRRTYLIVVPVLIAFSALLYRVRGPLLGTDLGTNWSLIAIALVLFGVMTGMVLEERELMVRFGEAYREYQREVPRIIPRLGRAR